MRRKNDEKSAKKRKEREAEEGIADKTNNTSAEQKNDKRRRKRRGVQRICCCSCIRPAMSGSDGEMNEAEQRMQRKTFTQWVNFHLESHSSSGRVRDLFTDLRDGVLLCHLVEVLTGQVLPVVSGDAQNGRSAGGENGVNRVYQMANLSTALRCLRATGLELVNNNVTDLADGNPRIWLGLIWQMILHFQVERSLCHLRESAWHQLHQQRQKMAEAHRPLLAGPSTSGGANGRTREWRSKESTERQLLRWVREDIVGDLGLRAIDLDRSWRDGRLLCALVHRFAPALMSRGEVLGGTNDAEGARQRAQRAIELARVHLGIRALIDPSDVCAPDRVPDRRSLIAYISQFPRLSPGMVPLRSPAQLVGNGKVRARVVQSERVAVEGAGAEELECLKEWLQWLHSTAEDPRWALAERQRVTIQQFVWFTRVRTEFWERRRVVVEVISARRPIEGVDRERLGAELAQLDSCIGRWQSHLAESLSLCPVEVAIAEWLSAAERLLAERVPVELDASRVDETLDQLEQTIQTLEDFFGELPAQRALLLSSTASPAPPSQFPDDSLLQPDQFIADLVVRMELVSEAHRRATAQMLFEQAHFRLLGALSRLRVRLNLWEEQWLTATTKTEERRERALNEWRECQETERPQLERLEQAMREAIPKQAPTEGTLGGRRASETETDTGDSRFARQHAQLSREMRLELDRLDRLGSRLNAELREIGVPEEMEGMEQMQEGEAQSRGGQQQQVPFESTLFSHWLSKCRESAQCQPRNGEELGELRERLESLRREMPAARADSQRWTATAVDEAQRQRCPEGAFAQAEQRMSAQLEAIQTVADAFSLLEHRIGEMERWTLHHDPDSEMARKSVGERANLVEWCGTKLAELEAQHGGTLLDFCTLRTQMDGIRARFTLVEIRRVEVRVEVIETQTLVTQRRRLRKKSSPEEELAHQELERHSLASDLEQLGEREPVMVVRISSLRERLQKAEQEVARQGPSSTQKVDLWALLKRKREVLARAEESEEEARASLHEMALMDAELGDELAGNAEFVRLGAEWTEKRPRLEALLALNERMKSIWAEADAQKEGEETAIEVLERELDALEQELAQQEATLPLRANLLARAHSARQDLRKRAAELRRAHRESLRNRMEALRKTEMDDLEVALRVLQEVLQEAEQTPQFAELAAEANELQRALAAKMEVLNAMDQLEQSAAGLEAKNAQWRSIQSAQIEAVLDSLACNVRLVGVELGTRCTELEAALVRLQDNFRPAEHQSARDRLRELRHKMEQTRELMEARQVFLLKLCAFKALVDSFNAKVRSAESTAIDPQTLYQELEALRQRILDAAQEVLETQTRAHMTVPDADVNQLVEQMLTVDEQKSSSLEAAKCERLERFLALASQLQSSFQTPLAHFEPGGSPPAQYLAQMAQSVDSEAHSLVELEQLANSAPLRSLPQPNTLADTVRVLADRMQRRRTEHQNNVEALVAHSLRSFRAKLAAMEARMASATERRQLDKVQELRAGEFAELNQEWQMLHSHLCHCPSVTDCAHWTRQWAARYEQFEHSVSVFSTKLAAVEEALAGKRERRMVQHLDAFGKLLQVVQREVAQLRVPDPLGTDSAARKAKFTELRDQCVRHYRLVAKLKTHDFGDAHQAQMAREQCEQYAQLMDQFEQMKLPNAHLIPIQRQDGTGRDPNRAPTQLSLASSSGSPSDLDSDLASVHSEVLVAEALAQIAQPSTSSSASVNAAESTDGGSDAEVVRQIAASLEGTGRRLASDDVPMDRVEAEVQRTRTAIDHMHTRYYSPKQLEEAQQDAATLKLLARRVAELKTDLKAMAGSTEDDAQRQSLQRHVSGLKREKNALKRFHKALTAEVEDELALRVNYTQCTQRLAALEEEVRLASEAARAPQTEALLAGLDLQIELLKKQCRAARKYVELSVDGSKCTSPSRHKRICLRLSESVTTIIQVIEDKWRREEREKKQKKKAKGKKAAAGVVQEESEFAQLHRKLTALKQETESEAERDEPGKGEGKSPERQQKSLTKRIRSLFSRTPEKEGISPRAEDPQRKAQLDGIRQMLAKSGEMRTRLEQQLAAPSAPAAADQLQDQLLLVQRVRDELHTLLIALDSEQGTSESEEECRTQLVCLVDAFNSLAEQFASRLAELDKRDQMTEEMTARVAEVLREGERLLGDPDASLEQLQAAIAHSEQATRQIAEVLSQPGEVPSATIAELKTALQQLKQVTQRLANEYAQSAEAARAVQEGAELLTKQREAEHTLKELMEQITTTQRPEAPGGTEQWTQAIHLIEENAPVETGLALVEQQLAKLEVELPMLSEIRERRKRMGELKEELKNSMEQRRQHLEQERARVSEVTVDVILIRREKEDLEEEMDNVERVVLHVPKGRRERSEQLRLQATRFNEQLVVRVKQVQHTLADAAAQPSTWAQMQRELAREILEAEHFVAVNGAEIGEEGMNTLNSNIEEAKFVQKMLTQSWQQWTLFTAQKELASNQMDKLRKQIVEMAEKKPLRELTQVEENYECLMKEKLALGPLKLALDELQHLAEQLEPLEMAFAEVRFLDVDFEQLEKQCEDLVAQMRVEMEHEKALGAETAQMGREVDELHRQIPAAGQAEALLHDTIPALEAKLATLGEQSRTFERRHVLGEAQARLDGEAVRIGQAKAQLGEALRAQTEAAIVRLQSILVHAQQEGPSEQRIEECARELELVPAEEPRVAQLREQVEELKWKKKRADAIQTGIDAKLATIGTELDSLGEQFGVEKRARPAKKRKGKQQKEKAKQKPRQEHIQELQKALELLHDDIVPTLSTLQEEASKEGIPMAPTQQQIEQMESANEIVHTLQAELERKVAEQATAEAVLNEASALKGVVEAEANVGEREAEDDREATQRHIDGVEEAKGRLAEQLQKLAEKISSPAAQQTLSPEELAQVKANEQSAKSKLAEMDSLLDSLRGQLAKLSEWEQERAELEASTSALAEQIGGLGQAQGLAEAEEQLRKLEALRNGADQSKQQLIRLQSRMPRTEAQLLPTEQQLIQLHAHIADAEHKLKRGVEFEQRLMDERKALMEALQEVNKKAQNAHGVEDPQSKKEQLAKLHQRLDQIAVNAKELDGKSKEDQKAGIIAHKEFDLSPVHEGLEELKNLLREEENDAQRKLANNAIKTRLAKELEEIQAQLARSEKVNVDPNATEGDLNSAIQALEGTKPHLDVLGQIAGSLEPEDPETRKIRDQALDEQSSSYGKSTVLLETLRKRASALAQFNEQTAKVEATLKELVKMLDDIKPDEEGVDFEKLEKQQADQIGTLKRVEDLAGTELKLLTCPTAKLSELQQLSGRVNGQLAKKKVQVENAAKQKKAIEAFAKELEVLDGKRSAVDKVLEKMQSPSSSELEAIWTEALGPLKGEMSDFEEVTVAPTEALALQRQQLKSILVGLEAKLEAKLAKANKSEELEQRIDKQIAMASDELAQILGQYASPQPMENVLADAERLEGISSALAALPLDEVEQKSVREKMNERAMPLRAQINASLAAMNAEQEREKQLRQQHSALEEQLRKNEAELPALEASVNYEVSLSRTKELRRDLPELRKKVEAMLRADGADNRKFAQKAIQPEQQQQKLAQLESAVGALAERLAVRVKVDALSGELETLMLVAAEAEAGTEAPLDRQQESLQQLEECKQKLTTLMGQIPAEADQLRQKSTSQLDNINGHIQRLGQALGRKMAAAAQLAAAKQQIMAQLEELNRSLEKAQPESTPTTSVDQDPTLAHLAEQEQRVGQLQRQLAGELSADELDAADRQQLEALKEQMENAKRRTEGLRRKIEEQIARNALLQQLREQTQQINDGLVTSVTNAQNTLSDPSALPQPWQQQGIALAEKIANAETFVAEHSVALGDEIPIVLTENINASKQVQQRLAERVQIWEQFVAKRDQSNGQMDSARSQIDPIEKKALRPLSEVEADCENLLEVQSSRLAPLNLALDELQHLAEQLEPLEMAFAEVRFLDVDFEQLEKQCEDLVAQMRVEMEHEKALGAETAQMGREVDELHRQIPAAGQAEALLHDTIPALEAKLATLGEQSRTFERRHVLGEAQARLDGEAVRIGQAKAQLGEALRAQTEAAIVRLQSILVHAQQEGPSEQRIEECARELELVPAEEPRVAQLREQVEELKWKKKRADAIQTGIDAKLATIGTELDSLGEQFGVEKRARPAKKRKGKQQKEKAKQKPRQEHIQELQKALELLHDDIVPTLSTLQEEASKEGIPMAPTQQQIEQMESANEIVHTLQAELERKVAEQATAEAVLNEASALKGVVEAEANVGEREAEDDREATQRHIDGVEEAKGRLAEQLQKLAEKISSPAAQQTLSPEELAQVKANEQSAKSKLAEMDSLLDSLRGQLAKLSEWEQERAELEASTSALAEQIGGLGQAQGLAEAEEQLRKLEALRNGADQSKQQLIRLQSRMPRTEAQLLPTEQQLIQLHAHIADAEHKLKRGVEFEQRLMDERKALMEALQEVNKKAQNAHGVEDPQSKKEQLAKLHQRLDQIAVNAKELDGKSKEDQKAGIIAHKEFDLSPVHEGLEELKNLLREEENDAQRKLANNAIKTRLAKELEEIQAQLARSEKVNVDPNATEGDLNSAIQALEGTKPHLDVLGQIAGSLEPEDPETRKIRDQALDEQSSSYGKSTVLLETLRKRASALAQFNEQTAKVEATLKELVKMLDDIKPDEEGVDFEKLEKQQADQIGTLKRVEDLAGTELKLLTCPTAKLSELQQLSGRVNGQLAKKKVQVENAAKQKKAIEAFAKELEVLDGKRSAVDKVLEKMQSPSSSELEAIWTEALGPLKGEMSDFEEVTVAPTEALALQRQQLKSILVGLEAKLEAKLAKANKSEELEQRIDKQIAMASDELAQILGQYASPQPMENVLADAERLEGISSALAALPLDEVEQKSVREKMNERAMPLRAQINASLAAMNAEQEREKQLRQQHSALEEQLRKNEAELPALEASVNYEVSLSRTKELRRDLPELRKKVEAMLRADGADNRKFAQKAIQPEQQQQKLAQLESAVGALAERLAVRVKVDALSGELETLMLVAAEAEAGTEAPLDRQQESLQQLEECKQKLTTLMGQIPAEADQLRQKSTSQLDNINGHIQRLGQALGRKMAAAAQLAAAKQQIMAQLEELNRSLEKAQPESTPTTSVDQDPTLAHLAEQEQRVGQLQRQLAGELSADELDAADRQQLEALKEQMENAKRRTEGLRRKIEEQIARNALLQEQLNRKISEIKHEMKTQTDEAKKLLNDPTSLPQTLENAQNSLQLAIQNAQRYVAENKLEKELQSSIDEADGICQLLDQLLTQWRQFIAQRDLMSAQLDEIRDRMDHAHQMLELPEAEHSLAELENDAAQLSSIRSALMQQQCPLQIAEKECRFLLVEVENVESANEELVSGLQAEIDQDREFAAATDQISTALSALQAAFNIAQTANDIGRLNEQHANAETLVAQFDQLVQDITQRSMVALKQPNRLAALRTSAVELHAAIEAAIVERQRAPSASQQQQPVVGPVPPEYDVDAAADVLSAVFADQEPSDVLRAHGLAAELELESHDDFSDSESEPGTGTNVSSAPERIVQEAAGPSQAGSGASAASPIPEDPRHVEATIPQQQQQQQLERRSRWRRILRTALPLQAMLVLLLGAACLVPHCDDEYCCHLLNNFARSFEPQLEFVNGPPPF